MTTGGVELEARDAVGRASFVSIGPIVMPAGYVNLAVDLNWKDVEKTLADARKQINSAVSDWEKHLEGKKGLKKALRDAVGKHEAYVADRVAEIKSLLRTEGESNERGRAKKSWAGLGAIIALAVGLETRNELSQVVDRQDQLHHDIELNRAYLDKTRNVVAGLTELMQAEIGELELELKLAALHEEEREYLRGILSAIYAAHRGEVEPSVVPPCTVVEMEANAALTMKKKNLKAVGGHVNVLAAPRSVVLTSKLLRVVFHVPVIDAEEETMELLRMREVAVRSDGRVAVLEPRHQFLAVTVRREVVSLRAEDLQSCSDYQNMKVCAGPRLVYNEPMDCLSAVYFQKELSLCKAESWEKPKEYVTEDLPGFYRVSKGAARKKCNGDFGSGRRVPFAEGQHLRVEEECSLVGGVFRVRRVPADGGNDVVFHAKVRLDEDVMAGMSEADQRAQETAHRLNSTLVHLERRLPQVERLRAISGWPIWAIVLICIAGFVAVSIATGVIVQAIKILRDRKSKKNKPAVIVSAGNAAAHAGSQGVNVSGPDSFRNALSSAAAELPSMALALLE